MQGTMAQMQRTPRDLDRWRKAQEQLLGGRIGPALAGYRVLVRRYPMIPELWFELGNAASGELDFALANQAYRRTRELAPHNASLLGLINPLFPALRSAPTAVSRASRRKQIPSSLSDLEQRQIHPALPCSAHGRPVRQY